MQDAFVSGPPLWRRCLTIRCLSSRRLLFFANYLNPCKSH